jgi:hypothetical protein
MKKPILTLKELKELEFTYNGKHPLDDGDFFQYWSFRKNDSEIHVTYEFSENWIFSNGFVDFNSEKLKGKELTKSDIEFLITIM